MSANSKISNKEICDLCGKSISSSYYETHVKFHLGETPFQCDICSKSFPFQKWLTGHKKRHLDSEKKHSCDVCGKNFFWKKECANHRLTHFKIRPEFHCKICERVFTVEAAYKNHLTGHANQTKYKCSFCPETFSRKKQFAKHEKFHTSDILKCFFCSMDFTSRKLLNKHEKTHGNIKCEFCPKIFEKSSSYKAHLFAHRGRKPFSCSQCGREFSYKGTLTSHIKFRHNKANLDFICIFCEKSHSSKNTLEIHVRSHTQERPFFCSRCDAGFQTDQTRKHHLERVHLRIEKLLKCSMCPIRFYGQGELNHHISAHTGERPYTCSTCPKTFKRNSDLKIHERVHSGLKPFPCGTCGKGFKSKGELRLHENSHLGLRPHKCKICEKGFTQNSHMHTHMRQHPEYSDKKVKCRFCMSEHVRPSLRNRHEKRCKLNPNRDTGPERRTIKRREEKLKRMAQEG